MTRTRHSFQAAGLVLYLVLLTAATVSAAAPVAGIRDSVLLTAPDGRTLWSHRPKKILVPASTQKIVTALAALHYLGEDFVYETHLYMEAEDLRIKGFGDPLLVSEAVQEIARQTSGRVQSVRHLLLDESHFASTLSIPGVSSSANPYDAPNGALSANFNTVFFRSVKGRYVSAEPQTPLLPIAMERIRKSGLKSGRIVFSRDNDEALLYTGHLFKYFLEAEDVTVTGKIRPVKTEPPDTPPLIRYRSPYALTDIISRLLEYSNNFMANQLIITCGIETYGAPGTLDKGVKALNHYAKTVLGLKKAVFVEGSGISRDNRMSAAHLVEALNRFEPRYQLMSNEGNEWYKTGHLKGIRTRAGYIRGRNGNLYRFAVLVNTPGKSTRRIMERIHRIVDADTNGSPPAPK